MLNWSFVVLYFRKLTLHFTLGFFMVNTYFYNTLNAILNQQKEKDLTILMGYFNAIVGYNNTGYEQTTGRHGIGQMNENGERFAELKFA
jgi:hypothetical protein